MVICAAPYCDNTFPPKKSGAHWKKYCCPKCKAAGDQYKHYQKHGERIRARMRKWYRESYAFYRARRYQREKRAVFEARLSESYER